MQEMRDMNAAAADWFANKHPSEWSKSHFSERPTCDMLLNNVCESFNSCILEARDKPIITMLEWLRQWMMTRFQECRDRANEKWKGKHPPKIRHILATNMDTLGNCIPIKSNNRFYQIDCFDGSQYAVDLELRTCSCRSWGLSGIPCTHACSAILHQKLEPGDFVDECYSLETYKKVYAPHIMPIYDANEWAHTMFIPPMPPSFSRKAGRPTNARKPGHDELEGKRNRKGRLVSLKRKQTDFKCSKCRGSGHSSRTCTEAGGVSGQPENADQPPGPRRQKLKVIFSNFSFMVCSCLF
ncbi:hypothetical protein ACS0TY_027368 [Phlomoides rotata]